ncbi:MAG: hypothetical protein K2N63_14145 [Lachnospiraceae bacterium]|nr:hypothetical protein [Lachnospiraceae bacterium]
MIRNQWRISLLFAIIFGIFFLYGCNMQGKESQLETNRHAFLLYDDMVFIADIPQNWRYILSPTYDYSYYRNLIENKEERGRGVMFIGVGEEDKDGEDNFFMIRPQKGRGGGRLYQSHPIISESFVFQDNTQGVWEYQVREDEPHYGMGGVMPFYEGNVYDLGENYHISLSMLGEEYDANEQVIKDFLKSACFRKGDLGISGEKEIWMREFLTLHIWNKSMRLSLQVPEGAGIESGNDNCWICMDMEGEERVEISVDYGGEMLERSGDYHYYLNVEDFKGPVYEIPLSIGGCNYYFPERYVMVRISVDEANEELWNCAKRIVQSIQFE